MGWCIIQSNLLLCRLFMYIISITIIFYYSSAIISNSKNINVTFIICKIKTPILKKINDETLLFLFICLKKEKYEINKLMLNEISSQQCIAAAYVLCGDDKYKLNKELKGCFYEF